MLPLLRREGCCGKCRGVADADGCCYRLGGKERRVPSAAAAGLHLLPVAGAVDDATTMAGACLQCIEMDELLLILTATNVEDGALSWRQRC